MMNPIEIKRSSDNRRIQIDGTILVAHQPECLPWLGNISKASMGDVYLLLDDIQFVKEHWQNKNKIRIYGEIGWQWLIVPLKDVKNHILETNKVEIDGAFWKKKHLKAFYLSYRKALYFDEIYYEISNIYSKEHTYLIDFLLDIIFYAFKKFNISVPVLRTSELKQKGFIIQGKKSDLIINMCETVGAKTFVFGRDGRTYIDKEAFYRNNIAFVFQDYKHPVYNQIHGEFISHMSFIDLLFNYGPDSVSVLGKSNYLEE